jgi:ribosomal protein S12 methylthiotransferase accessory factor
MEMIDKYRKAGIKLYLSDFSLDTGIPSVGALAYDPSTFPKKSEIVWTAGTTPNPQKALSRALTEVAQLAGDFNTGSNYVASGLPKFTKLEDADYITKPEKKVDISTLPDLSNDNIKIEVENLLAVLARKNMEVIVVNTMHHLLEIPAFYSIIPGAHFRERAMGTSVGMFATKLITENNAAAKAIKEYFTRALELDPTDQDIPSIYSYMGICFNEMERYRNAIAVLKEAEKHDEERTDIYNLMGFSHFKLKEHAEAISCFKKVLQLDPSSAIDYANIGSNYREMGEKTKAIRFYEMALALDPTIDFAKDNLVKLLQS